MSIVNTKTSASASAAVSPGRLFVLSAPSGTGKTSITSRLRDGGLVEVSISHTTRPPRDGERDGEAYFFVSEQTFLTMRDGGSFLEWAEVYGNYYGTSREWVASRLAAGANVLLEIDCQGALQVKGGDPRPVMIFISPPDIDTLRQRLQARGKDDADVLERRLAAAADEMAQQNHFDYVIINDDLDRAVREVAAIISPPDTLSDTP